jgi:predicted dehydrogenase
MSINPELTVVGADHPGGWFADNFVATTACGQCAIVDGILDNAPAGAHKRGVDAYRDYPGIPLSDAMSLVVPTGLHYKIAREFLEAGIHCPAEMPITQTVLQG